MASSPSESSSTSLPLSGRTVLITGANTGIGRATAVGLASKGASLVLAGRSRERTEETLAEIKDTTAAAAAFLPLDLGNLQSVKECADAFLAMHRPLHVLINNAGVAGGKGLTKDGFELAFGINHVGHYLLTRLLEPALTDAATEDAPSRVVNVASKGHFGAKGIDFDAVRKPTQTRTGYPEYEVSKLANVVFSAELARRWKPRRIHSYALHPGVVASDVWRQVPSAFRWLIKRFMISNEDGALTSIHCAASPSSQEETGLYYDESRSKYPSRLAQDEDLATKLWDKSEEWVCDYLTSPSE